MGKTLVIVESPSKAKTIEKFLGKNKYEVLASVGHVRDLPKSQLGIDVENDFAMKYITIRGKGDKIKELKKSFEDVLEGLSHYKFDKKNTIAQLLPSIIDYLKKIETSNKKGHT